jgi:hypothetical protein
VKGHHPIKATDYAEDINGWSAAFSGRRPRVT